MPMRTGPRRGSNGPSTSRGTAPPRQPHPQERPQLSSLERTAVSGHGDLVTAGEAQLLETLLPAQARRDTAVSAPRPAGPSSNAAGRGL